MIYGQRTVHHPIGVAPAAAELHGPDIYLIQLARMDLPVGLLDENTLDAMPVKIRNGASLSGSPPTISMGVSRAAVIVF
jgi:hypothetical protein